MRKYIICLRLEEQCKEEIKERSLKYTTALDSDYKPEGDIAFSFRDTHQALDFCKEVSTIEEVKRVGAYAEKSNKDYRLILYYGRV